MKKIRVALTGGGTGGHIYPLITVARRLRERAAAMGRELELRYYGPRNLFSEYLSGEGVPIYHISSSKYRSYALLRTLLDIPVFWWSLKQVFWKIFWFMPDVVFSKGGPGALPVLLACYFYRVPIVIHESDAVPSRTNRIAARWACAIAVGFPGAVDIFKKITRGEVVYTGNPVAGALLKPIDIADARRVFGLAPHLCETRHANIQSHKGAGLDTTKKTLLFLGGSQGSTRINDFVYANLDVLLEKYYVIHQVGNNNYEEYLTRFKIQDSRFKSYFITAYLEDNLAAAYAAADLVIGRAGAEMISEVAALGKPAVLIPFPEAAQDHQRRNAYEYAATGAAMVVEEENLLPDLFLSDISKIIGDANKYQAMSVAAKRWHRPTAGEEIAKIILRRL